MSAKLRLPNDSLVESLRGIRKRVHENATDADRIGCLDDPESSIPDHGPAEPVALLTAINSEPTKDDQRDRVRHVAAKTARSLGDGLRRAVERLAGSLEDAASPQAA